MCVSAAAFAARMREQQESEDKHKVKAEPVSMSLNQIRKETFDRIPVDAKQTYTTGPGMPVDRIQADPIARLEKRIADLERQVRAADALARANTWTLQYVLNGGTQEDMAEDLRFGDVNLSRAQAAVNEHFAAGGRF